MADKLKSKKWNDAFIRQVKVLVGDPRRIAKEMELGPEDMVLVTKEVEVIKVEGAPVEFLMKRAGLMNVKESE